MGEWLALRPGRLSPHWIRGWFTPELMWKPRCEEDNPAYHPVVSCYTDWLQAAWPGNWGFDSRQRENIFFLSTDQIGFIAYQTSQHTEFLG
jgi:hypothetical protein